MSIQVIKKHFQTVDPILFTVMEKINLELVKPNTHPESSFASLCEAIISQQLSTKVADVIHARFLDLLTAKKVTPEHILTLADQQLRDIGLSWAKVKYVKDLAEKVLSKEVRLDLIHLFSEEEVITELTKVKGIGRWTAEMFLMFHLGRENVFSFGDLGLKKGFQKVYLLKELPREAQMRAVIDKWSPYKTYGSKVLWRSLEI